MTHVTFNCDLTEYDQMRCFIPCQGHSIHLVLPLGPGFSDDRPSSPGCLSHLSTGHTHLHSYASGYRSCELLHSQAEIKDAENTFLQDLKILILLYEELF